MAELSQLARPYAKAVFELARSANDFAGWSGCLAALASLVQDPSVAPLLNHPKVTRATLVDAISQGLKGTQGDAGRNLVRLLVENGRLTAAPQIAEQFEAMRAEAEQTVEVEITAAVDVPEAQRSTLVKAIGERLARQVQVQWHTDPELIAGAVIRAGDLVIDGSAKGELARLQTVLAQ